MIKLIINEDYKKIITRKILESLPEWFGISEAIEEYILGSIQQPFYAAFENELPIGFLYLKETGKDTIEIAVIGVLSEFHHRGIGKKLFNAAKEEAIKLGYSFIQVKTVKLGVCNEYDDTNKFYKSIGFKEFEVFPKLWDDCNPCQVYVMALR